MIYNCSSNLQIILSIVALILFVYLWVSYIKRGLIGFLFVIAGALGILIQRLGSKCVLDDLNIFSIHFNFYDVLISLGIFVIITSAYGYIFSRR